MSGQTTFSTEHSSFCLVLVYRSCGSLEWSYLLAHLLILLLLVCIALNLETHTKRSYWWPFLRHLMTTKYVAVPQLGDDFVRLTISSLRLFESSSSVNSTVHNSCAAGEFDEKLETHPGELDVLAQRCKTSHALILWPTHAKFNRNRVEPETPSQSYRVSLATFKLPATGHKWTHLAITPARQAGILDLPTPEGWKAELTKVTG